MLEGTFDDKLKLEQRTSASWKRGGEESRLEADGGHGGDEDFFVGGDLGVGGFAIEFADFVGGGAEGGGDGFEGVGAVDTVAEDAARVGLRSGAGGDFGIESWGWGVGEGGGGVGGRGIGGGGRGGADGGLGLRGAGGDGDDLADFEAVGIDEGVGALDGGGGDAVGGGDAAEGVAGTDGVALGV